MQNRGQRALHPRQVARVDPDATARVVAVDREELPEITSRHRRPTVQMSADEIERVVAEAGPRRRLARGSSDFESTPMPVLVTRPPVAVDVLLDGEPDPYPDPSLLLLPFHARRPVLATLITAGLAVALLLAIHGIIAAG
jgi:hypothetical protein